MVLVFLELSGDDTVRVQLCVCLATQRLEDMQLTDERIEKYVKKYENCEGHGYQLFESLFRNTIRLFFLTLPDKKKFAPGRCDICHVHKRSTQLQRAHSFRTRLEIGKSICSGRGDNVISNFLKMHRDVPLWILCRNCHKQYPTWDGKKSNP
jgi:hypothetical protein